MSGLVEVLTTMVIPDTNEDKGEFPPPNTAFLNIHYLDCIVGMAPKWQDIVKMPWKKVLHQKQGGSIFYKINYY